MLVQNVPELTTINLRESTRLVNPAIRNESLLGKLRISHSNEGLVELKEICLKYNIFRLPGDRLQQKHNELNIVSFKTDEVNTLTEGQTLREEERTFP
jgi:hypothetical protein